MRFAALALGLALALPALAAEVGPRLNLKSGQILTGRFTHDHPVQGFDAPFRTEGTFTLAPENGIVWAIERPMKTRTTIANGTLTQSVGQVALFKVTAAQQPVLADIEKKLLYALSGDWKKLEKDYIVTRSGDAQSWSATITPRETAGAPMPFQKIVARGGRFVDSAEVHLRSAVDRVTFSDQRIETQTAGK